MRKLLILFFALLLSVSGAFAIPLNSITSIFAPLPPPTYYSIDDLSNEFSSNLYFYFADAYQPANALVKLDTTPLFPCSTNKRAKIAATLKSNPSKYRVKAACIDSNHWTDNDIYKFDWTAFTTDGGRKGDLVFLRSDGGYSNITKLFSGWTHVAMVYNAGGAQVLEAMPVGGVAVNNAPTSWGNVSYYTCKSVYGVSAAKAASLIESGKSAYLNKPYIPQVSTVSGIVTFAYTWANKDDMSSMYCSKLVYNTYKGYLAPDNGTSLTSDGDGQRLWNAPCGSWVGVSPDDIYYSSSVSGDYAYSPNLSSDAIDYPSGIKK